MKRDAGESRWRSTVPNRDVLIRQEGWRAQAHAMKDADPSLSNAEIGRRLGRHRSAVLKALNPDRAKAYNRVSEARPGRREQKTAWDRAHYVDRFDSCECGTEKLKRSTRCQDCFTTVAAVRRTLAEGMWADGWSLKDMSAAFGVTAAYFGVRRLDQGWDLPYRYGHTRRQVAA